MTTARGVSASSPGGIPILTPAQKVIYNAAALSNPDKQERALQAAICEGLASSDSRVREEVLSYLSQNVRWLDVRPYSVVIEEMTQRADRRQGAWLLDEAELAHGARDERIKVFGEAIKMGETQLPHGRPLSRDLAMAFAAIQGLEELEPLVQQYSAEVSERWKKSFQFASFPAMFELGAGAEDREAALRLAADRLGLMRDHDLRARMGNDAGFRMAVLEVADDACAVNPFSGQRNGGCKKLQEVVKRQASLGAESRTGVASATAGEIAGERTGWLDQLKERVPAD